MPGPSTIIPGTRRLVCKQTATCASNGAQATMTPDWLWQEQGTALEILYGVIDSGTVTSLTFEAFSQNQSMMGGDPMPAEFCVFESPPEEENVNPIGLFLFNDKFGWQPKVADESGSGQSVTIYWFGRPWPLELVRKMGIYVPKNVT